MKAKSWQEMKNLSSAELDAKLRENEEKLFRMKFRHSSTPLKNPLEIRETRRVVAKLKTLIKQQAAKKA